LAAGEISAGDVSKIAEEIRGIRSQEPKRGDEPLPLQLYWIVCKNQN
jgi:hypothetical protein